VPISTPLQEAAIRCFESTPPPFTATSDRAFSRRLTTSHETNAVKTAALATSNQNREAGLSKKPDVCGDCELFAVTWTALPARRNHRGAHLASTPWFHWEPSFAVENRHRAEATDRHRKGQTHRSVYSRDTQQDPSPVCPWRRRPRLCMRRLRFKFHLKASSCRPAWRFPLHTGRSFADCRTRNYRNFLRTWQPGPTCVVTKSILVVLRNHRRKNRNAKMADTSRPPN
jgi:hypothetical protein